MQEINRLREIYRLKEVERSNSVGVRKESSAEHSWSCLILADYFLSKSKLKINRLKVYELLMYHDLVEIETGDICISKVEERKNKDENERKASAILAQKLPSPLQKKFKYLFQEFLEQKTIESRFAKAIDHLDAELHELDYKEDWKGWTEEFLRSKKEHLFKEFPEMADVFEKVMVWARKEGFFSQ